MPTTEAKYPECLDHDPSTGEVGLGLAGIVMHRFPEWGPALATTMVAVITLNQIIGPIAFKFALSAVGEARAGPGRQSPSPGR